MPTDPFENTATDNLWAIVKQGETAIGWEDAVAEIDKRFVKASDTDDTTATRGAIRPTRHNPLL